jgi:hypothetical protein
MHAAKFRFYISVIAVCNQQTCRDMTGLQFRSYEDISFKRKLEASCAVDLFVRCFYGIACVFA